MKKHVLLAIIILVTFVLVGYIHAQTDSITACVKNSGQMYLIGDNFKKDECNKKDSLLSWNIEGPQGPKGDKGDVGPQGPVGLLSTTTIVSNTTISGPQDGTVTSDANCPTGSNVISGGTRVSSAINPGRAFVTASYPINSSTWRGVADAASQGAGVMTITTYAICVQ